jgi:hypothetical protein
LDESEQPSPSRSESERQSMISLRSRNSSHAKAPAWWRLLPLSGPKQRSRLAAFAYDGRPTAPQKPDRGEHRGLLSDVLADPRALLPGVAFDTIRGTLFNPGRLAASLGISATGDGSFDRWMRERRRSWCKGV